VDQLLYWVVSWSALGYLRHTVVAAIQAVSAVEMLGRRLTG